MTIPKFSFEFFPPKSPAGLTALVTTAVELEIFDPTFVSITYGAGGSTQDRTLGAIETLSASLNTPIAGHLTCVGQTKEHTHEVLDSYVSRGVRQVVALRGDPSDDAGVTASGFGSARELVAAIRQRPDGDLFHVSVAAYPEVHPKAASAGADLDSLVAKIDAGADRAITQFFFDTDAFLRFRDRVDSAGISVPLVPGIMPIHNVAGAQNFSGRVGTSVPAWLPPLFEGLDDNPAVRQSVATAVALEQCDRLVREGVTDLHFYVMNKANLTAGVCRVLQSRHADDEAIA